MARRLNEKLAETNRMLVKQWHPTKNALLTPATVMAGSARRVWWKCGKGHEWLARISHRNYGAGCPYCSGRCVTKERSLAVVHRQLTRQWHPDKNLPLLPKEVASASHKKVWWRCKKGHEWQARISNRAMGKGCPYCAGKKATKENSLATVSPLLAKEWHPTKNALLTPDDVIFKSARLVWWKCRKGHEWQETVAYRSLRGRGCPVCIIKARSVRKSY
ncbi:MAG: zinc-ribbon domain-containing protein [Nitrospirae bacterium]|nr:zinc-ribbon domain-containing protein [Nitrospirota bacterium]